MVYTCQANPADLGSMSAVQSTVQTWIDGLTAKFADVNGVPLVHELHSVGPNQDHVVVLVSPDNNSTPVADTLKELRSMREELQQAVKAQTELMEGQKKELQAQAKKEVKALKKELQAQVKKEVQALKKELRAQKNGLEAMEDQKNTLEARIDEHKKDIEDLKEEGARTRIDLLRYFNKSRSIILGVLLQKVRTRIQTDCMLPAPFPDITEDEKKEIQDRYKESFDTNDIDFLVTGAWLSIVKPRNTTAHEASEGEIEEAVMSVKDSFKPTLEKMFEFELGSTVSLQSLNSNMNSIKPGQEDVVVLVSPDNNSTPVADTLKELRCLREELRQTVKVQTEELQAFQTELMEGTKKELQAQAKKEVQALKKELRAQKNGLEARMEDQKNTLEARIDKHQKEIEDLKEEGARTRIDLLRYVEEEARCVQFRSIARRVDEIIATDCHKSTPFIESDKAIIQERYKDLLDAKDVHFLMNGTASFRKACHNAALYCLYTTEEEIEEAVTACQNPEERRTFESCLNLFMGEGPLPFSLLLR
ncbi:hypothetical protein HDU76_006298 [Blyttiomyces sp. JEL0837]|nr:hypothetical protein HDU76_006298 [Blyttiomyces sp. JEL0837]